MALLRAVLKEDVRGEFVDGKLDVKARFVRLKGKGQVRESSRRTEGGTRLEMVVSISQDLRTLGSDGRDVEIVGGGPIGRADGDGIGDGGGDTDGRRESRETLLEEALYQPQGPHKLGGEDSGVAGVGVGQGAF